MTGIVDLEATNEAIIETEAKFCEEDDLRCHKFEAELRALIDMKTNVVRSTTLGVLSTSLDNIAAIEAVEDCCNTLIADLVTAYTKKN